MPRTASDLLRSVRRTKLLSDNDLNGVVTGCTDPFGLEVQCPYCSKSFATGAGQSRHIALVTACREAHREVIAATRARLARKKDAKGLDEDTEMGLLSETEAEPQAEEPWDYGECTSAQGALGQWATARSNIPTPAPTPVPPTHEELPNGTVHEFFPVPEAGCPITDEQQPEADPATYLKSCGRLADPDLFEIAELLMTTGLSNASRNRLLKSKLYKGKTPWKNCQQMLDDVDKLPKGAEWTIRTIITRCNDHNHTNYLFARDILAVIRELIGNRRFKRLMRYAPVRHWRKGRGGKKLRVYGEMWTADWWWDMQWILSAVNKYATIVPLIIATNKTCLLTFSGGQEAYPVYLTIGNISKSVRCKAKERATVLIGYLPVDKFEDVTAPAERARLRADMTHRAMEELMAPLKTASEAGFKACRGDLEKRSPPRKPAETLAAIRLYQEYDRHLGELEDLRLKPWWPWWADLPHVNFHASLAPDLLHQLHQGIFKSHILPWAYHGMKEVPANWRFQAMSGAEGMRHFKRKISKIQRWTGRESKELMKQFLPVVVGSACDPDFVEMVHAALDFMYYAHSAELTDEDLKEMDHALKIFNRLKPIVVKMGAFEDMERFNGIAKLHMLSHYTELTRKLGAPDGYNSESPEHLHIIYAKTPYRASNKVQPTKQMVKFVDRQDALRIHKAYLLHVFGQPEGEDDPDGEDNIVEVEDDFEEEEQIYEEEEEQEEGGDGEEEVVGGAVDIGQVQAPVDNIQAVDSGDSERETTHYPAPVVTVPKSPTKPKTVVQDLVELYGASDLISALSQFLESKCHVPPEQSRLSLNDTLPVWHRFSLRHAPLPFAPAEPCKRDSVRARRAQPNRAEAFDTIVFKHAPQKVGLERYRAARVRAIFGLPGYLQHLSHHRLVYLELFTPFPSSVSLFHRMYTTNHQIRSNRKRHCVVVPVTDIVMSCHLAPNFRHLEPSSQRPTSIDTLSLSRRFFFNPHYNHYVFKLCEHWRRTKVQQ